MSPQVNPLSLPNDGATGWGQQVRDAIEALRVAHNATDTATGNAATAAGGKYTLPGSGIPKSDLATAVQTSLGKADSALQQETYASALPGQRFTLRRSGGNWTTRPTNRADIFFDWTGALPAPDGVTVGALVGDKFVEEG